MDREKSVVVADDDPHIADLLADLLENEGYKVRVAYDGEEALAATLEERPDLLLSDVMMPCRSGLDVVQTLRTRKDLRDIPVILTSAAREPEIRWPGVDFIPKPFRLDRVVEAAAQRTSQQAQHCA